MWLLRRAAAAAAAFPRWASALGDFAISRRVHDEGEERQRRGETTTRLPVVDAFSTHARFPSRCFVRIASLQRKSIALIVLESVIV